MSEQGRERMRGEGGRERKREGEEKATINYSTTRIEILRVGK